jgi:hypothetical protein
MKIVDRKTFLAMPRGTVYAKYAPCYFEDLAIKEDTWTDDFLYQAINDALAMEPGIDCASQMDDLAERSLATGSSIAMDFDCLGRDGLFDEDQLFAVWEPQDVRALIARLQRTLGESN